VLRQGGGLHADEENGEKAAQVAADAFFKGRRRCGAVGGGGISERLAASIRPEQAGVGGQHGILVSALDRGA
jgi:hypothetical protein